MHKTLAFAVLGCALLTHASLAQPYSDETEITILTEDSVVVFGDLYDPDVDQPMIILFHQGGGNGRAEYGPIVPRLLDEGFSALAIDQRRGGDRLGGINRTVEAAGVEGGSYCDAGVDVEATLDYVHERFPNRPVILWGSSYSAALAIRLAAIRPDDVKGVLGFSPASGDPMDGCRPEEAAGTLVMPAMMLRPASEVEYDWIREQLHTFSNQGHRTYVAENGVHGSSMLNSERTGSNTEETWDAVLSFLKSLSDS